MAAEAQMMHTYKYTLAKSSTPSWEFNSDTLSFLHSMLNDEICTLCKDHAKILNDTHSQSTDEDYLDAIDDLMDTDCGCEYYFEINVKNLKIDVDI